MTKQVDLVAVQAQASLDDAVIEYMVRIGKMWDLLDFELCRLAGRPRHTSVLATRGRRINSGGYAFRISLAEIETLGRGLCSIETVALSELAWEMDDFWACPEDADELGELVDHIMCFFVASLAEDLDLYLVAYD